MHRLLGVILGSAALATALPVSAQSDPVSAVDASVSASMQSFHIPGGALAVARDGTLLHTRGFGYADAAGHHPITAQSLFLNASLSKPLTAMAIFKLIEAHKLSLDNKAYSFFKDLSQPRGTTRDPRLDDITVRDLLDHAGGWDRTVSGEPAGKTAQIVASLGLTSEVTPLDAIHFSLGVPLDFAPGTRSAYSNFGFIMLGQIVERVSGQTYERFVRDNVLLAAGVGDGGLMHAPHAFPGEVQRYDQKGNPLPFGSPLVGTAAGGWVLSPADWMKILNALQHGKILTQASLDAMFAPPYAPLRARPNGSAFGLGWDAVARVNGQLTFSKDGGSPGVHTWVEHRADGLDDALFFNGGEGDVSLILKAKRALDLALDRLALGAK
jgi:CubicO group peptidase (beta-lactamase class C family)